jgi:hypothetical protein
MDDENFSRKGIILEITSEVQMKKGLRWIPRHPETKKGA